MHTVSLKLVTIVADELLEERLIREIKGLGARGYTISAARGEGVHGSHTSEVEGVNVKIETLVSADVADRIVTTIAAHYFPNHAVIIYTADVQVVRAEKYQ